MFEYYNNILCVQANWLYNEGEVITRNNYRVLTQRGWLNVLRRGCKGTPALVEFDSMKTWIKETIIDKYGDPYKKTKHYRFKDAIQPDSEAADFYSLYRLSDGRTLKSEIQREYRQNAEILNAIHNIVGNQKAKRKALGGSTVKIWDKITEVVNTLNKEVYPHTLPSNTRRLKERYKAYKTQGYTALIHKNFGNDNSRKVNVHIESLIISLSCLPNKPYNSSVHELYLQFLGNAIDVVDLSTGELFNPEDFYENGMPVTVSESTVWNYLKKPRNQLIIKKHLNGNHDFSLKHRPHVNRTAPKFSMSKISLDDRDIMHTRLENGSKVFAYYAFDDLSGAMVGIAHSKEKVHALFINCMRNMFRFLDKRGLGIPMQVEVEHHLVSDFKDGLMKVGNVFPFVRWCNATNSQEKYAETQIRVKKYGVEKKNNQNVGRHYSRLDANRVVEQKIFDAENNNYKKATASYEQIVANELQEMEAYNNELHPNQKMFKGMTRLDVFLHYVNPDLPKLNKAQLAKYIGNVTKTSVRRSQYVQVNYEKYQLSSPEVQKSGYSIPLNLDKTEPLVLVQIEHSILV